MSWDSMKDSVLAAVLGAGGLTGLAAVLNAWATRRNAAQQKDVDLRRVTDEGAIHLIQELRQDCDNLREECEQQRTHRTECEKRLRAMEAELQELRHRLDQVSGTITVLRLRDEIMRRHLEGNDAQLPNLPLVIWPPEQKDKP